MSVNGEIMHCIVDFAVVEDKLSQPALFAFRFKISTYRKYFIIVCWQYVKECEDLLGM